MANDTGLRKFKINSDKENAKNFCDNEITTAKYNA